ncbi:RHS repeat-associated core domain-containing protein, partial [Phocaeicola vulgatus]
ENELTGTVMRYDYDRFDFLIRQETTQGSETDVIYRVPDFVGNLFGTPDRKDRKYGAGGKLLEDPDCFYHYDDEGNLIFREFKQLQETGVRYDRKRMEKERGIRCLATGTGWLYEWASNGMLKKVIRPDGRPVEFRYDALGRRTAKQYFGKVTHWVWDGNVPIHEWSYRISDMQPDKEENGPSKEPTEDITTWVFEVGTFVPTAKIQEGKQYSIVSDYLGTPIQMYNELGNKIWECTLDIFGEVTNFEGNSLNDCPFRYQGQYKDEETELYYNRFRYYSQEIGGYLSQDPIRLAGNNPTIYGYVRDTCTNTDPFGLMPWPNPINSGHHLVYANKARSVGLDHLASNTDTPTYFFNEPYAPGTHERVHASQRKFVGPRQGPWTGSAEELIEASKKGLIGLDDIKGKLIIPSTGEILAENATPLEAFEKLEEWHKRKMASIH